MASYEKQTWVNGAAGGTPVDAARLNHMEQGILDAANGIPEDLAIADVNGLQSQLDGKQAVGDYATSSSVASIETALGLVTVNVMGHGAVADGVTDDSAAFSSALSVLASSGGGRLVVPPRVFALSVATAPVLTSNTEVVAYGATFRKIDSSTIRAVFVANTPEGQAGYGGGLRNFTWRGGRFEADFANAVTACPFGLHHAQHCVFEDITFYGTQGGTGHTFDLGAADDVVIRNCWFVGQNIDGSSRQAEAVNVDGSYNGTLSSGEAKTGFSGLLSKNVTVEKCHFVPYTQGAITYPAPNPMGTHFVAEGKHYENIRFLDNVVINPRANPAASTADGSADDWYAGAVHMPCVDGLYFSGNKFQMTEGYQTRALTVMSVASGVLASSDPSSTPATKGAFATPVASKNIWITDNVIEGFNSADGSLDSIYVKGVAGGYVDGVHITGNTLGRGYSSGASSNGAAVLFTYVNNAVMANNTVKDYYRGLYGTSSNRVTISNNQLIGCTYRPILFTACVNFSMSNNLIQGCSGPIQVNSTANTDGTVVGNVITEPVGAAQGIVIVGGTRINVMSNVVTNTGTTLATGISLGASLTNSIICWNIIQGYTNAVAGTGGTGVTVSDNH